MAQRLRPLAMAMHILLHPEAAEIGAEFGQLVNQRLRLGRETGADRVAPKGGDEDAGDSFPILDPGAGTAVEEHDPKDRARRIGGQIRLMKKCARGHIARQHKPFRRLDDRRQRVKRVEHALQKRRHPRAAFGRAVLGEQEQMLPLRIGQTKGAGETVEHIGGRRATAPLLKPSVPSGADMGELGDLFAAKTRGAAMGQREAEILRLHPGATLLEIASQRIDLIVHSQNVSRDTGITSRLLRNACPIICDAISQKERKTIRVFVTGATGFVGSAVVQELIGAGHEVLGLVRSDASAETLAAAGGMVLRGDLKDLDSLRNGAEQPDGVIHTGFIHDFQNFADCCAVDRAAITAMGEALVGSGKPFIVTSGTGLMVQGQINAETDPVPSDGMGALRGAAEGVALAFAARGVRAQIMRLPNSVHGAGDHGFVPILIGMAQAAGRSAYIDGGMNHWPAVAQQDAARAYILALEKGAAGSKPSSGGRDGAAVSRSGRGDRARPRA